MRCPACGQENPAGFRFCGACGAALDTAPAREERKVVTVLFADLVGFTARAETMDPEDVRALLAPYHARLREELERYGGTVEKFIGDAVMALFGAPVAHEDDPERAVRAAIAIRDWVSDDDQLQVRIAINTGETLVALGARPERGEGMASGDVVNTAARLQSAAPTNGILVGETTYRATRHVIDYREAPAVDAKGKAESIRVWEALTPRARVGVDVVQSTQTPLVGRDHELGLLIDTAKRVRDSREPQLVTLVGVPGVGKSRLTFELFRALDAEPDLWTWRQGRCLPYGDRVTFWPVGEIVKSHSEIFETDAAERAREKLRRLIDGLIDDPADAAHIEEQLRPLVGAGADLRGGIADHGVAFAAWRRFFEALGDETPLVLVIEDLHWADDAMLEFIDHLVDWATDVPILIIGTARPELLERRPGWGGGKANATTLSLAPLSDGDTAQLLAALLERPVVAAETQRALLERAGGNPLYAEQYAQMYLEHGDAGASGPPETIQGLIAARIDALGGPEKGVLQDASVHGKVFWDGAVAAEAETLHALARKEFIRRQRRSSVAGETEYAFRHMLVRDVAYSQIPRAARAAKHVEAAGWIEKLAADRDDHVELRASHYANALDLARSSSTSIPGLESRARRAFSEAGARAFVLGAFAAAETHYRRALDFLDRGTGEHAEALLGLGKSLLAQSRGGTTQLVEASAALVAFGETTKAAEAEAHLAAAMRENAQTDLALDHLNRATAFVRDAPDSPEKLAVLFEAAWTRLLLSDYGHVPETIGEAIALAERIGDAVSLAWLTFARDMSRIERGEVGVLDESERTVALAGTLPPTHEAGLLANLGVMWLDIGALDRAFEIWQQAEAAAFVAANPGQLAYMTVLRGRERYYQGDWDEALRSFEDVISTRPEGFGSQEIRPRTVCALIRVARGDGGRASEDAEHALELARSTRELQSLHTALAVRAYIAFLIGDGDVARDSAREALGLIAQEGTQQVSMSLGFLAELVASFGLQAEFEEAVVAVRKPTRWKDAANALVAGDPATAAEIYAEIGSRPDEARAHLIAAHTADTEEHLRAALAFYRSVGATRYVREAEALLAAAS